MKHQNVNALFDFIEKSPTAFQAVDSICERLNREGFLPLSETDTWNLQKGQGYYVTRN